MAEETVSAGATPAPDPDDAWEELHSRIQQARAITYLISNDKALNDGNRELAHAAWAAYELLIQGEACLDALPSPGGAA